MQMIFRVHGCKMGKIRDIDAMLFKTKKCQRDINHAKEVCNSGLVPEQKMFCLV